MSPEFQDVHPAILEMPYHPFVPSEFDPECGRCDKCGGGEGAPEHQKPVDQMARIADALEGILEVLTQRNDWEGEERARRACHFAATVKQDFPDGPQESFLQHDMREHR